MTEGAAPINRRRPDRFGHFCRTLPRLMWLHGGRHPLEWFAGPTAVRARKWHAARKPWNRSRKPLVRHV